MKHIFNLCLWAVLFALSQPLLAKGDYLLTTAGDTLKGSIFLVDGSDTDLDFYAAGTRNRQRYQASDFHSFRTQRQTYESLPAAYHPDGVVTFARVWVVGTASLWARQTDMVLTTADTFYILSRTASTVIDNKIQDDIRYRGLLRFALQECSEVGPATMRVSFRAKAIAKLVDQYNDCIVSPSRLSKSVLPMSLVIWGGASLATAALTQPSPFFLEESYSSDFTLQGGMLLEAAFSPRISGQLGVNVFQNKGTFTRTNLSRSEDALLKSISAMGVIGFKGYLNTRLVRPFVTAGLQLGRLWGGSVWWVNDRGNNSELLGFFPSYLVAGPYLSVGVEFNRLKTAKMQVEYRVSNPQMFPDLYSMVTHTLAIGVRLGGK